MVLAFDNPRNPRRRPYTAPFSPSDIATLQRRFSVGTYTYSDAGVTPCVAGNKIQRIYDTTNSEYLEQTDSAKQFTYRVGANGKAYAEGSGGQRMEGSTAISAFLRHMIVTALKRNSVSGNTYFYFHNGGSAVLAASNQGSGTQHDYYGANGFGTSATDTAQTTGSWLSIAGRIDATNYSAIRNGAAEGSTGSLASMNAGTFTGLRLGGWLFAGYEADFNWQEHLIFANEPTSGEQASLQTYLAANYPT
jgi:hypothetical protein